MAADVAAGTVLPVEPREDGAAAACTRDFDVQFVGSSQVRTFPVRRGMMRPACHDFEILLPVVRSVTVSVVDLLTFIQRPVKLLLCDDAVFVDVPAYVGSGMIRSPEQYVSARVDDAAAAPVPIRCASGTWTLAVTSRFGL